MTQVFATVTVGGNDERSGYNEDSTRQIHMLYFPVFLAVH